MSSRPRPGEIQPGFAQGDRFMSVARTLGFNIKAYAELLAGDSLDALQAIKSPAVGTDLEQEWPLTSNFVLEAMLRSGVKSQLDRPLGPQPPLEGDAKTYSDASLTITKYHNQELGAAYGRHAPRERFVDDFVGWTAAMDERGWPLLVDVDMGERHRITVGTHKDTEAMKAYLDRAVTGPRDSEDTWPAPRWLSDRVLVRNGAELPEII